MRKKKLCHTLFIKYSHRNSKRPNTAWFMSFSAGKIQVLSVIAIDFF